jgi:hypothetical protein
MPIDFDKLAEAFEAGTSFLGEDESVLLATAVETILMEKEAGRFDLDLDEREIIFYGAAIADKLTRS